MAVARHRLWPSFETRASKSAVADFDTVGCQSQAGLTLVRAPLDEVDVDMIRTSETLH
jgi:hypothetical protein